MRFFIAMRSGSAQGTSATEPKGKVGAILLLGSEKAFAAGADSLAEAFAGAGDDGLPVAQPRLQRNRGVQRRRPRVRRP